jgi:hypothetical protein
LTTFELTPHHPFSQEYKVELDGQQITDINPAWLIQGGQLAYAGKNYKLYREESSGAFVLEEQEHVIARAKKNFTPSFDVSYNGTHYTLTAKIRERTCILEQGSQIIGSVDPKKKSLSRKAIASIPDSFPRAVQIFITWLAILLYRPENVPTTGHS